MKITSRTIHLYSSPVSVFLFGQVSIIRRSSRPCLAIMLTVIDLPLRSCKDVVSVYLNSVSSEFCLALHFFDKVCERSVKQCSLSPLVHCYSLISTHLKHIMFNLSFSYSLFCLLFLPAFSFFLSSVLGYQGGICNNILNVLLIKL